MSDQELILLFYARLKQLRNNGVMMKDISDKIQMQPSVLSSLFTTVLPSYEDMLNQLSHEEALDWAISQVNNVSKKRLLSNLSEVTSSLENINKSIREKPSESGFLKQFNREIEESSSQLTPLQGIYQTYSISSSASALKIEPLFIRFVEDQSTIQVVRKSVYGILNEGTLLAPHNRTFYLLLNESHDQDLMLVTIYIQLPFHHNPGFLKGVYLTIDYNNNPIARRIVLKKISNHYAADEFDIIEAKLIAENELNEVEKMYYHYVSQPSDMIRMCHIPTPQINEHDLEKEKEILASNIPFISSK